MPADHHALVAIPAPAPSIPARWRLYHGGAAKGGRLVTHDRASGAYLGDLVYFSPRAEYARRYVPAPRGAAASRRRGTALFVVDARTLPPGCRILVGGATAGDAIVEERLMDLIDAVCFARAALQSVECPPEHVRWELDKLSRRLIRCRRERPDDPSAASAGTRRRLEAALRGHRPDPAQRPADRFSSMLLYLLEAHGTLEPTAAQLEAAIADYRRDWLAAFSVPFDPLALGTGRPADRHPCSASDGLIVLVPGPVPVLDRRHAAGRTG